MKLVIYIVSSAFIVASVAMMAVALGCADFLGMIQR
jgi:hypothetical protein